MSAYKPAETVPLESWPAWRNALFGGLVLAFVVAVLWITSRPVVSAQLQARNAIIACDMQHEMSKQNPDITPQESSLLLSACTKLRDEYRHRWGHEP